MFVPFTRTLLASRWLWSYAYRFRLVIKPLNSCIIDGTAKWDFSSSESWPEKRQKSKISWALCWSNSDIGAPHTIKPCVFFFRAAKPAKNRFLFIFAMEAINRLCNFLKCNAFYLIAISVVELRQRACAEPTDSTTLHAAWRKNTKTPLCGNFPVFFPFCRLDVIHLRTCMREECATAICYMSPRTSHRYSYAVWLVRTRVASGKKYLIYYRVLSSNEEWAWAHGVSGAINNNDNET